VEGEDIRRGMSDSSSSEEEEKEEERSVCEVCGVVDLVVVGGEAIGDGDVEGEVVVWSSEEEDMLSLEVCWGGGNESIVLVDLMRLVVIMLTTSMSSWLDCYTSMLLYSARCWSSV
jgi:hypothetical protein